MEVYDFYCQKGGTFRRKLRLKKDGVPVDLTGWTGKSQVRTEPDGGELLCEIGVTIDTENSAVILTITAETTAGFAVGNYAWDIRLTNDEDVSRYYLGGKFVVVPSVTE